jgi:hypothetical protein
MRWPGNVTLMVAMRMHITLLFVNLKEIYHLEDQGVDRRTVIQLILKKKDVRVWAVFN